MMMEAIVKTWAVFHAKNNKSGCAWIGDAEAATERDAEEVGQVEYPPDETCYLHVQQHEDDCECSLCDENRKDGAA